MCVGQRPFHIHAILSVTDKCRRFRRARGQRQTNQDQNENAHHGFAIMCLSLRQRKAPRARRHPKPASTYVIEHIDFRCDRLFGSLPPKGSRSDRGVWTANSAPHDCFWHRWRTAKRAVLPDSVVMLTRLMSENLRFVQSVEDFPIQQLISQFPVERFTIIVFRSRTLSFFPLYSCASLASLSGRRAHPVGDGSFAASPL